MSGHSKFANIKHRKEKNDAQKGKIFTKLGREIMVAVKQGGADPENNTRLKEIINKAKSNNMPNDTISRSIKKASGEAGDVNYENITYEGYGPGGVAVMVVCLTDNKNRTAANVRHALSKYGGNLGTTGCVSFMFEKKGQIVIEKSDDIDEDELMMAAIEAGAEDMNTEEEGYEILIEPDMFNEVNDTLSDLGYKFLSAEVTMMPSTMTELGGDEDTKAIEKMLDQLEEDDDVQDVYTNWDR
ncbi:putative factor regulating gene expression [Petrocella atlantisensis]|uniref:Probable transcriptional regulatory protein PATL70BA_3385 n=1 Tax=Petrocella atlantisensis TaxID=2173034 RepID=A0A3P7S3B1_9FIRM|nr:YebC/PmpR family DNA-binding transcriptional regulator [Petrocella atlantisensis]VDN49316.1 putative factor regulating gene expression [Petrocella atlantisensis]